MNWRVSSLDGYRLVSNSDAHSPPMLGREATAFELPETDYFSIYQALRTGDGFGGTVEFFPEEGKYHLDGHRACDVRMTPEETRAAGGKCPACGKKPTIGVQHRVDVLADRPEGYRLDGAAGFKSFVPLPEILGEIAGVGPKSKSVTAQVSAIVERFGPELGILGDVPLDDLAAGAPSIVAEAIARLRRGEVRREAGYDGVYGTIRLFDPDELAGAALFDMPRAQRRSAPGRPAGGRRRPARPPEPLAEPGEPAATAPSAGLDPEQHAIVTHDGGPLLVVAGPGAGKTRVLTHAIAHRIGAGLAARALPGRHVHPPRPRRAPRPPRRPARRGRRRAGHGRHLPRPRPADPARAGQAARPRRGPEGRRREDPPGSPAVAVRPRAPRRARCPYRRRQTGSCFAQSVAPTTDSLAVARPGPMTVRAVVGPTVPTTPELAGLVARYDAALRERGMVDLDDLVTLPTTLLAADPALAAEYRARWTDVFVDEYQDVDEQQYLMLRQLAAPGSRICAIGDPDQAIYGFRGGDVGYFLRFEEDFGAAARPEHPARRPPRCGCRAATAPRRRSCGPRCS